MNTADDANANVCLPPVKWRKSDRPIPSTLNPVAAAIARAWPDVLESNQILAEMPFTESVEGSLRYGGGKP